MPAIQQLSKYTQNVLLQMFPFRCYKSEDIKIVGYVNYYFFYKTLTPKGLPLIDYHSVSSFDEDPVMYIGHSQIKLAKIFF